MAEVERRLERAVARLGRPSSAPTPARRSRPAASGCARCSSCSAPAPAPAAAAIRAATAIELVHMATLVHDDVLDAAPLRRGLPTVVATSGRERAVGDRRPALLARLRRARRRRRRRPAADRQVELLAHASVALARGELAQRRDAFDTRRRRRALPRALPAEDGGAVRVRLRDRRRADRPPRTRRCARFGREIGLAFQLLDDVLDVPGPPERTGKARGTDLLDGTVTLPLILARERDPELAELDLRALDAAGAEAVCDRIAATGAPERGPRRGRASGSTRRRRSCATPASAPSELRAARAGRRRRRRALQPRSLRAGSGRSAPSATG